MKKLVLITFLLGMQLVSAQEVTKNLGDFSTVRVFDRINLTLVASNENKIVVTGSRANDVEIVTKNNDLKIRMKLTKLLQGENVSATLYYKKINEVEASEGSFIGSQDTFKGATFFISSKEGSHVKLNLNVEKLSTKINSSGEVELSGKATNHDATITSGGILKGRNFPTTNTRITISAGGEADVNASNSVDAKTRAGGDVSIYGNPKNVTKKTTAGGSIEMRS